LSITAAVKSYQPGRVSIELDAPAPEGSALMVSENWYPGWRALVDGKPVTVGKAAVSLMGIPLPAGARAIEMSFENPAYETGKAVTWGAVALAVLLLGLGVVMDRRRVPAGV
jgi:uncharacterized membrane protein YfhO